MKPPDDAPVNPIDRDLVDAFAALDRTVPEGALDDFAARVAARLDGPEKVGAADLAASSPPAREDSGLHDIKALASSAKRRASEREQSESDVGESYLLTASPGGLRAVALPEAGQSGAAGRRERGPGTRADARSSAPFWILGGVASLAAVAAVAVFVFGLGRDQDGAVPPEETNEVVARVEPPPPPENVIVAPPPVTTSPDMSGPAERIEAKATDEPKAEEPDQASPRAKESREADEKPKAERTTVAREARTEAPVEKNKEAPRAGDVPTAEELGLEPEGGAPRGGVPPEGKGDKGEGTGGNVELGDMLDEVAGKKPPAPPPPPPDAEQEKKKEPEKKELDRRAVTRALEEVRGAVEKCHELERFTGVVTIKFAVAPSGQVSSAAATGAHARSRTGSCVADAVKQARFEPFEGSPISFTLPFRIPGGK